MARLGNQQRLLNFATYENPVRNWQIHRFRRAVQMELDQEQTMNYVLFSFREDIMFRAVVKEAAALASITLFLGMVAVWSQVIASL